MKPAVLADKGPLYAALDSDDAHHKRARHELQELAREKRQLLIAYPILLEAYSLVLFRLGKQVASRWLNEIIASAVLFNPHPEDYQRAMSKSFGYPDQPITLVDATLAVLALRIGAEVWTYDHHFDIMRVDVWR